MGYYPQLCGQSTPSRQLIVLSTQLVKFDNVELVIDLITPMINSKTVFIHIDVQSTKIPSCNFDTISFITLPTCFTQPPTSGGLYILTNWSTQCQNNGCL